MKAGQPGLESGVFVEIVGFLPRAGSRRGPVVWTGSVADGRFTSPEGHGASLLFSIPNGRLTNQTNNRNQESIFP